MNDTLLNPPLRIAMKMDNTSDFGSVTLSKPSESWWVGVFRCRLDSFRASLLARNHGDLTFTQCSDDHLHRTQLGFTP